MEEKPQVDNVERFLCPGCGANMVFDAASGQLKCPYCAQAKEIVSDGRVDERDYHEFLARGTQSLQPMAANAMMVRCESCGATVNFTPPETATNCDFCGAKIVAQPKAADPLVAPEGVLPFSVTPPAAVSGYQKWISSLWFAPSALKSMARADKLSSVYIPYWTYDSATRSFYTGERGDYYYETETYYENGEERSREVRKTNWYRVQGELARRFDDVCIPATTSLPDHYLRRLEPWDLHELKPYEPAYLSGHKAQTYQIALDAGFDRFRAIANDVIREDARQAIGGDEQRVHDVSTDFFEITFKHLLLPIYAGAYHFNGRVFQIVINGRTGEVQGERPYSWIKIAALVAAILFAIVIIVSLFALFKR